MSQQFIATVVNDLGPAIQAIATAATRVSIKRAEQVALVSGGAVETTPEQLTAIESVAAQEMFTELAAQLRDVANVYVVTINQGN